MIYLKYNIPYHCVSKVFNIFLKKLLLSFFQKTWSYSRFQLAFEKLLRILYLQARKTRGEVPYVCFTFAEAINDEPALHVLFWYFNKPIKWIVRCMFNHRNYSEVQKKENWNPEYDHYNYENYAETLHFIYWLISPGLVWNPVLHSGWLYQSTRMSYKCTVHIQTTHFPLPKDQGVRDKFWTKKCPKMSKILVIL